MRVISGSNRGLKLLSPKNYDVRPTEDRVKENVFNLIGQNFYGAKVLDLFSGSGAIGIEFLSRGAEVCYFVDNNSDSVEVIKKNIEKARQIEKSVVFNLDAIVAINRIKNVKFDYIYIDPPYNYSHIYLKSIKNIIKFDILNLGGLIIIEEAYDKKNLYTDSLKLLKERKYGNTYIGIWSLK